MLNVAVAPAARPLEFFTMGFLLIFPFGTRSPVARSPPGWFILLVSMFRRDGNSWLHERS